MAPVFPPNLDDGELWLPAGIIPDVLGARRRRQAIIEKLRLEAMDNKLEVLGLLDPARYAIGNPLGFMPMTKLVPSNNGFDSASNGFRVPAVGSSGGTGAFLPAARNGCSQVENVGRGRVLQRHGPARSIPVRPMPVRGKESGGTGVFLPRVVYHDVKSKPKAISGYDGEEQQKQKWQQQAIRYAAAAEEQQQQQQFMASRIQASPAEITLPQEWTY